MYLVTLNVIKVSSDLILNNFITRYKIIFNELVFLLKRAC